MEFKYKIFDTHSHYDDEAFDEDREAVFKQIKGEWSSWNFKLCMF